MHRNSAMLHRLVIHYLLFFGAWNLLILAQILSQNLFWATCAFPNPLDRSDLSTATCSLFPLLTRALPPRKTNSARPSDSQKKTHGKRDFSPHSSRYTPLLSSEGVNNAVRSGKGACRRRLNKNGRFCIQFLGEINVGIIFFHFCGNSSVLVFFLIR